MTWYKKLSEGINWIIKLDTDERFDPLINSVRSVIWVCKLRTSKLFSKILPTIHTSFHWCCEGFAFFNGKLWSWMQLKVRLISYFNTHEDIILYIPRGWNKVLLFECSFFGGLDTNEIVIPTAFGSIRGGDFKLLAGSCFSYFSYKLFERYEMYDLTFILA